MKRSLFIALVLSITLVSCNKSANFPQGGVWRGSLVTADSAVIPFNFELKFLENDTVIDIITGDYRYEVKNVNFRGDSLFITMPLFSSEFALKAGKSSMTGSLIRSAYTMPFTAVAGVNTRFDDSHVAGSGAAGRWQITLGDKEIIGEFADNGKSVTGSFLTPTGDYRFFEGVAANGGKLMLSCFDGGFIRVFTADIDGDTLKNIVMRSGFNSVESGSGFRNENASLPDAYSVTGMKRGYSTLGFSFPNMNGVPVSLSDERFKNRVTVVQISGSWCPNCLDESRFLMEMYEKYSPSMEVICLAFERSDNFETAKSEAGKLAEVAGIGYDVLITGHTPAKVRDALPELENFRAFPTTVIVDKKGLVRRIHSGFSGPGTGVHFLKYKEEFMRFIEELIAE
jgi:thiol-disulfide isomerase/thioredoxin